MAKKAKETAHPQVTYNGDRTLIHFGTKVRMDRHIVNQDGCYTWTVYILESTNGRHPIGGDETIEEHVWMPRSQGSEEEMRAVCENLSGIREEN